MDTLIFLVEAPAKLLRGFVTAVSGLCSVSIHTCSHTSNISHILTYTHRLALACIHIHTLTLAQSLTPTCIHTLIYIHSQRLILNILTHSLTYSCTHTDRHTLILTHSYRLRLTHTNSLPFAPQHFPLEKLAVVPDVSQSWDVSAS